MITTATLLKSLVSMPGFFTADVMRKSSEVISEREGVADLLLNEDILNQIAMISVTGADGYIRYANQLYSNISGFSNSEIVGQHYHNIYHEDTSIHLLSDILETVNRGQVWKGELKCRKKDGGYYWVMNTVVPVMGPGRSSEKYISIHYDISRQKKMEEMVEEYRAKSFRDLYDNVKYAGHIHRSLMPDTEEIKKIFPQSFVNYIPRNIIGGDFFWFAQKEGHRILALGDSTGHGVSASLISSLAVSNLINIIEDTNEIKPAAVLNELNRRLSRMTNQNNQTVVTESADTAVLDINMQNGTMTYASGKTRVVLLRNQQLLELEKDKGSIGGANNEDTRFHDHEIQLQKGDRIFMYSDGYIDQFGGRHNKRLGSKRLRIMLEKTSVYDMDTQAMLLREYILHWKGENNQTDDISMIGVEID